MQKIIYVFIALVLFPFITNGQDKDWIIKKDSIFSSSESDHFTLHFVTGHISIEDGEKILSEREIAYKQISDFFEINSNLKVNIFLFENERLKYEMTGHNGYGWGFENNIVEVYNDTIKVDPYHELVHILGYTISEPTALIDEGTAVYLSQKYGNKPFSKLLGYPGKSINEILLLINETERLIDLETLISYNKISEATNVILAYCESASFVEFLIKEFGKRKYLEFYKSLSSSDIVKNALIFQKIYGNEIEQIEKDWIKQINK